MDVRPPFRRRSDGFRRARGLAFVVFRRKVAAVASLCACALIAGCGGAAKQPPTPRDVDAVAAAVSDIVYECQSVAAGYVASPDSASLKRDVNMLVGTYQRVQPNVSFVIASSSGGTPPTTLRKEISLAEINLAPATCAPGQAKRLQDVLRQ